MKTEWIVSMSKAWYEAWNFAHNRIAKPLYHWTGHPRAKSLYDYTKVAWEAHPFEVEVGEHD